MRHRSTPAPTRPPPTHVLDQSAHRDSQPIAALNRPAGGIAHDFNNLLTAIKGYSDLILMDLAAAAEGRSPDLARLRADVEQIREATRRAAALAAQLMDGAPEPPAVPQPR